MSWSFLIMWPNQVIPATLTLQDASDVSLSVKLDSGFAVNYKPFGLQPSSAVATETCGTNKNILHLYGNEKLLSTLLGTFEGDTHLPL